MNSSVANSVENPSSTDRGNSVQLALDVSELRYRRLFETAQDGILILDATSGRIIDVNPFLLDLLDYPFESMIGLRLWEIGIFSDIAANEAAFEKLQKNEYIRYEDLPLRTKSGKEVAVEFVSNVYSVGPDKVIQCNIRLRSQALADCCDSVSTLKLASKAKDKILAIVSHELRTPLNAISYAAELLESEFAEARAGNGSGSLSPSDDSSVRLIRRNVRTLGRLMNELLDLTHIAKGTLDMKLELMDAHEVIRFAVKNLESQPRARAVKLRVRLEAKSSTVRVDAGKLEQVVSNLISNALKFTPKGGLVVVATHNDGDGKLVIEVRDTGIGISALALPKIFQPFEQGDAAIQPQFGGLGLGLSIARSLMEAQNGTLAVQSDGAGYGSTFKARFETHQFALTDRSRQQRLAESSSC